MKTYRLINYQTGNYIDTIERKFIGERFSYYNTTVKVIKKEKHFNHVYTLWVD